MNRRIRLLSLAVLAALVTGASLAGAQEVVDRPQKWDPDVVKLASTLPVQADGRVKPLSTYADFALLRLNGKRSAMNIEGERLTPTEWLLDALFYPEAARQYETFLIEAPEVVNAIGVSVAGKGPRDRYSYQQLEKGLPTLFQLAQQYFQKEAQDRSIVENQIVNLAHNVREFELITHYLDFARHDFLPGDAARLKEILPGAEQAEFATILSKVDALPTLHNMLSNPVEGVDAQTRTHEQHQVEHVLSDVGRMADLAMALALFPPTNPAEKEWRTPADLAQLAFTQPEAPQQSLALLASLEKLAPLRDNPEAFKTQLATFHGELTSAAEARGEYAKVPLEYFFYKGDARAFTYTSVLYLVGFGLLAWLVYRPRAVWAAVLAPVAFALPTIFLGYLFYQGLLMFVLSFVLVAALWMRPNSRFLNVAAPIAIAAPTLVLLVGITLRCIIRGRPPVSTLYETILFITASMVIVGLAIEWMNRRRIALSVASTLGVLGLFLANKYEMSEGVDTMPSLVAVLDTNFWLSTHVTTVTLGYAAGLLAAAIAHVYIVGRLLGLKRSDKPFYKSVSRMTYGVLCFGLFFAILGTVLGGIWANESWGRFWGWDPKENGALMIVLWQLAILHARMGGYIRDLGLSIAAVFGGIIVAFSWWGVNLLGVGLHSYGFTSGAAQGLAIFYGIEMLVVLMGGAVWLRERRPVLDEEPEPQRVPARGKAPRPAKG